MRHDAPTVAKYVLAALALAALLALAPFFLAAGLMAPGWAVAVFIAVWLALFVVGCLWCGAGRCASSRCPSWPRRSGSAA